MPKPVLAAVNGPAVGIGLSLALASDLVVAAESAYLLLAFVNIGLVPDGGSSLFVPDARRVRARHRDGHARRARSRAAQALEWGLVNRVVPDDAFAGEVAALRDRLAAGPTRSYAGTKRQLNHWLYARMEEQLELEADIQQEMAGSPDFAEGVAAFVAEAPARVRGAVVAPPTCRRPPGCEYNPRALARTALPPVGRVASPSPSSSPSPRCWPSPARPSPTR